MNHTLRRILRRLSLLLAIVLVAVSCGGDDDQPSADPDGSDTPGTSETVDSGEDEELDAEPQYGGSIVVGLESETNNWLPGNSSFASSGVSVAMAIYDPLVTQSAEGEIEPNLAESIEPSDDLTEWTVKLRPGIEFHDGSPLDAETLVWNFETLHSEVTANTYGDVSAAGIEAVEAIDDLTVVYRLSGPNPALSDVLRGPLGWPVSRQAYESMGREAFSEAPVGTGPFVFQEWRRDDRLIVTRNENYWRKDAEGRQLPFLDGVEFRPIPDEDTRVQSLASDTVQVISTLRGTAIKSIFNLEDGGGYTGSLQVGNIASASIFNVMVPPVDDVRIRRALTYTSDTDQIAAVLGDDGLVPYTTQFVSEHSPWFSSNVAEVYPGGQGPDLAEAQRLIEDYRSDPNRSDGRAPGDPIEIEYTCPPDATLVEIGQLLQHMWGEAGVVVNVTQVDQATMVNSAVGDGEQDPPWAGTLMAHCWRTGVESDPLTTMQVFFGPVESSPGNVSNFTHPDIDEAIETLRTTADFATRYEAFEKINMVVAEHVPIAWASGTPTYVAWRDDIHGIDTWRLPSGAEGRGTYDARVILHHAWLDQS